MKKVILIMTAGVLLASCSKKTETTDTMANSDSTAMMSDSASMGTSTMSDSTTMS